MHSTLKPRPTDDPHDVVVVAPDDVLVAPADEEISNLLREAARHHSGQQTHAGSGLPASPPVPLVDTTFRPAAVNDVPGHWRSIGRRVVRAVTALLLAACIGVAAIAWQSSGDVAKRLIAKWAPQFVLTSLLQPEEPGLSAQPAPPAVEAAAANAAPPQTAPLAQTVPGAVAPPAAAPSPDSAQLLQSMARDLASVGQEVEQLKTSIQQLKASQQQMSRDIAKASEAKASEAKASENKASELRPRISAPPPRPAAARTHRPMSPYPLPQAAAAPNLPLAAAPYPAATPYYAPRQVEPQPQIGAEPQADPELASIPRPPMPVR